MKTRKTNASMKAYLCYTFCTLLAFGASAQTWTGETGDGMWTTAANWSGNAVPTGTANFNSDASGGTVKVNVTDTRQIQQLQNNGTANVEITIANGQRLTVANGGSAGIQAFNGDITINGPGFLGLSTSESQATGINHIDNGANPGRTLTINAQITDTNGGNSTGFETWRGTPPGGTVVMGCPTNAFTMSFQAGSRHVVVASKLADIGQPSSIGAGPNFVPNRSSILRYTGTGDTTDRGFLPGGGEAAHGWGGGIEQAGTGPLYWTGPVYNSNNSVQTLSLLGDSASPAYITGNIYNNQGTLGITKDGIGTWVLSGNNTFTGPLAIEGGTLCLDSATAAGSASQIVMASHTTLSVNPSATPGFTARFATLYAPGNNTINVTVAQPASGTSSVTFDGVVAQKAAFTVPDAGASNKIFINGLLAGNVAPWITINGLPASYSFANGLTPLILTQDTLDTKGNPLPDDPMSAAAITQIGTGPDIWLDYDPTTLFSLTQTVTQPGGEATVNLAGKMLTASKVAIGANAQALTIGATPKDGNLLPPILTPPPITLPSSTIISNLNPLVWHDATDASTIVTNANGSVIELLNKGDTTVSAKAVLMGAADGVKIVREPDGRVFLRKADAPYASLVSDANLGISGNAPRTMFAAARRWTTSSLHIHYGGRGNTGYAFGWDISGALAGGPLYWLTWSNDIQSGRTMARDIYVLTHISGRDGNNLNLREAWHDGAYIGSNGGGTFNTENNRLRFYERTDAGTGTIGDVGEVILFDRALTDPERIAVENYLMEKWRKSETPSEAGGSLVLANDSSAPLTVNAAIQTPYATLITLIKEGTGNASLAGGVTLYDRLLLDEGTLTVNTPQNTDDLLSGGISGNGKLAKDGPGTLLIATAAANTANLYQGGTDILAGLLKVANIQPLGSGDVTIHDGATLDFGGSTAQDNVQLVNRIFLAGAGVDGEGAIVCNGTLRQWNAGRSTLFKLTGDATFGGSQIWDISRGAAVPSLIDLDGNTLTKRGANTIRLINGTIITNAPFASARPALDIQQGLFAFEQDSRAYPNDAQRTMNIAGGGTLGMYGMNTPLGWAITADDGATIHAYDLTTESTNRNVLAGPVSISGQLNLTANANQRNKHLAGPISGTGSLNVNGNGPRAMTLLSHPNNTFDGSVTVNNASLGLRYPGSLPGGTANLGTKLTVNNNSAVRAFAGGNGWTATEVMQLAECGPFDSGSGKFLQLDVAPDASLALPAFTSFRGGIEKFGTGTLVFEGDLTMDGGPLRVITGGLIFTNTTKTLDTVAADLILGETVPVDTTGLNYSHARFGGNTVLKHNDNGYNRSTPTFYIGYHGEARSVLDVTDDAQVSAKIIVANNTGAMGAVYQSGNAKWVSLGGGNNDARIGRDGFGYWQVDSGELIFKGSTQLGMSGDSRAAGTLRQKGGAIIFNGERWAIPPEGQIGDSYGGALGLSRGGRGVLHLEGGTFEHYGEMRLLDESENSGNNGWAVLTVDGTADAMVDRQIYLGHRNNAWGFVNLLGGKLTVPHFLRKDRASSVVAINFNGGTLCVTNDVGSQNLFVRENAGQAVNLYVYGGGAIIEIAEGLTRTIDIPITPPNGNGVISVEVLNGGTGFFAPPYVDVTGGNGNSATAIADIDRQTGSVTSIRITNPGHNYTANPNINLIGGGGTGVQIGDITRAPAVGGGLTKTGQGTLTLSAANTYQGPTCINGGTLLIAHLNAIPKGSEIIIGDGTLDLGGNTITNDSVVISGTGAIVNGKIHARSVRKTGPGTATLDAEIEFPSLDFAAKPGLWEGRVIQGQGVITTTDPNPGIGDPNAVELTTTAANGFCGENGSINGKQWPNYSTYIYTGYIWNRSGTNETWTFAKNFDDAVWMSLDKEEVFYDENWNATVRFNLVITPGAHAIEIRFGQGNGGAGTTGNSLYGRRDISFGVDYLGRDSDIGADYEAIADTGNGHRLTLTIIPEDYFPYVRIEEGTLLIPSGTGAIAGVNGGVLDLDGIPSCAGLVLSPAGDDHYGNMGIANPPGGALNGATYRVTLGSGSESDLLTILGTLDLTGLIITPANLASESPAANNYVIAAAPGGFTGLPTVTGFTDGRNWKVHRRNGGTQLVLSTQGGTILMLR